MIDKMKPWQHGYDLDYLKEVEFKFDEYNKICLSPFAVMKKNRVAERLHKRHMDIITLDGQEVAFIPTSVASRDMPIKMFPNVTIAIKSKGDRVIENPVATPNCFKYLRNKIDKYTENCWMFIHSYYDLGNKVAYDCGFEKVGVKINSFSDITNVYYKQNTEERAIIGDLHPLENMTATRILKIDQSLITPIRLRLSKLGDMFANHYSNYNKSKAWSAVALKGYSPEIEMIEKPDEMNDKWKKEHEGEKFELQETKLMPYFEPEISFLLSKIPAKFERIRFMKLNPNMGELQRHTDQTDRKLGIEDGQIMRLHIPIFTNDMVIFTSWGTNGQPDNFKMKEGELWYLDIRKPHRAINGGKDSRIHLVIDVIANEKIREMCINESRDC